MKFYVCTIYYFTQFLLFCLPIPKRAKRFSASFGYYKYGRFHVFHTDRFTAFQSSFFGFGSSIYIYTFILCRYYFLFFFSLIRSGCITTVTCHFIVSVYSFWSFLMAECICIYDERYLAFESIVNMYRLTKPFYGMCWRENCYYFSTNKIFVLFYGHSWFYFSNINKPAVCQMVEISSK